MRSDISDPMAWSKILLDLPASRYLCDTRTAADLGQLGVNLHAA